MSAGIQLYQQNPLKSSEQRAIDGSHSGNAISVSSDARSDLSSNVATLSLPLAILEKPFGYR